VIHVIALLQLRPGTRAAFLETFHDLTPKVRAEKGCLEYAPAVDHAPYMGFQVPVSDDVVVVIERWASPAALDAHIAAPHMKAWGAKVDAMMVRRTIHVLDPVGSGGL
jgi:quinol monooxygenase YgiN